MRGNLKLNCKFVETTASPFKHLIALIFHISLCVRNNSRNYSVCPHMLGVQLVTVITTNIIAITMLKGLTLRSWSFTSDLNARELAEMWRRQEAKSRSGNFNPVPGREGTYVSSNHFLEGKQPPCNPETD